MKQFREGQRVLRVSWNQGEPYLEFGKVTKTTRTTQYVNEERNYGNWKATARAAIRQEYRNLFQMWDTIFGKNRPADWTVEDTVVCVCKVRRLEDRLIRRRTRNSG